MAGYYQHIDDIRITQPPFMFPSRAPTTTSRIEKSTTLLSTTPIPSTPSTQSIITTHVDSTPIPNSEDYKNVVGSIQNGTFSALNESKPLIDTFYRNNLTTELSNITTITTEGNENNNGTFFEDISDTLVDVNGTMLPNATKVFDWVKPTGVDLDNNILSMSPQDTILKSSPEVRPDYTLYIILGSILTVLIILTIVTIMLYKAYKSQDQYSLTRNRNQVRVFRAPFDSEQRDDFEVVEIDKDSYKF